MNEKKLSKGQTLYFDYRSANIAAATRHNSINSIFKKLV